MSTREIAKEDLEISSPSNSPKIHKESSVCHSLAVVPLIQKVFAELVGMYFVIFIVMNKYKGLWVSIVGPPLGTIAGGFAYNLIRFADKALHELAKSASFVNMLSLLHQSRHQQF